MTDLNQPIELVLIERSLESEDFDRAAKGLEKLRVTPGKQEDPYFYLIDYYWGQILFRKEMGRKRVREKKIDLSIKYLNKSLKANSDFVDAHLLLGLAFIVKSRITDIPIEALQEAKIHFQICRELGNSMQKEAANGKLSFIQSAIENVIGGRV